MENWLRRERTCWKVIGISARPGQCEDVLEIIAVALWKVVPTKKEHVFSLYDITDFFADMYI